VNVQRSAANLPRNLQAICYILNFADMFCLKKIILLLLGAATCLATDFQGASHLVAIDEEGIGYSKATPDSAIARLQKRLDDGESRLEFDEKFGYLPALLRELKVPLSSQILVFSKTSLQRERISPSNPRAVFFNDDVYLGWIPGSPLIEISVADPKMGGVFYTLEQSAVQRPNFKRNDQCLECHASTKSMGVPGHLIRSFETDDDGVVDLASGTSQVSHRTPFAERWGGWYVSGTHGEQVHRGNLIGKAAHLRQKTEPNFAGNCTNLSVYFDTAKFAAPHSDLVALMVLEHQAHMHNYLTRLNIEAARMIRTYGHANYLRSIVDGFVKYLLFAEEAPLAAPLAGTSTFRRDFEADGPRDSKGRSLREFDLTTRLFKYPCSYLIYSEAFDAIPDAAKEKIYEKLHAVLSGKDQSEAYAALEPKTRRAILEILLETKKDLPDYWHSGDKATAGN
jgi:hypothetical protein